MSQAEAKRAYVVADEQVRRASGCLRRFLERIGINPDLVDRAISIFWLALAIEEEAKHIVSYLPIVSYLYPDVRRIIFKLVPRFWASFWGVVASVSLLHYCEMSLYVGFLVYLFRQLVPYTIARFVDACESSARCRSFYHPGWYEGMRVDVHDHQWRMFRENYQLLVVLAIIFLVISALVRFVFMLRCFPRQGPTSVLRYTFRAVYVRTGFYTLFAIVLLVFLHSAAAVWPIALVLTNYLLIQAAVFLCARTPTPNILQRWIPGLLTWGFALGTLAATEWYHASVFSFARWLGPGFSWLDHRDYQGSMRWEVSFNLVLLRTISYNMDFTWASRYWARRAQDAKLAAARTTPVSSAPHSATEIGASESAMRAEWRKRVCIGVPAEDVCPPDEWEYLLPPEAGEAVAGTETSAGIAACPVNANAHPSSRKHAKQSVALSSTAWARRHRGKELDQLWVEARAARRLGPDYVDYVQRHVLIGDLDWRIRMHQPMRCYFSPLIYLGYVFYAPLLLAGPILPFNAFISQMQLPQKVRRSTFLIYWAIKLGIWIYFHEIATHCFPAIGIAASRAYLRGGKSGPFGPLDIGILGYATVNIMWSKFVIIWRAFRFWALLDGVDTQENMDRCISDHYTLTGFWRSWHRSYNRWLVRYIYIPLGGSKYRIFGILVVFMFVAIWHDMTLQLLLWGWILVLGFVPETAAGWIFSRPSVRWIKSKWYWRYFVGAGGTLNICMLMIGNLIGFSIGTRGMADYLSTIFRAEGIPFIIGTLAALFSAVQVMIFARTIAHQHRVCKMPEFSRLSGELATLRLREKDRSASSGPTGPATLDRVSDSSGGDALGPEAGSYTRVKIEGGTGPETEGAEITSRSAAVRQRRSQ